MVFAALAVSRWIEAQTGWLIRKFVNIAHRYRTVEIQGGQHVITAADLPPTNSAEPWWPSTTPANMCTNLSQLGSQA
jgi:hypothetical protein